MTQHNGHPERSSALHEERDFARMGEAARRAAPTFCPDLHVRIMRQVQEAHTECANSVVTTRAQRQASTGMRFGQLAALAAAVCLLTIGAWLWPDSTIGLQTRPMTASNSQTTRPGARLEVIGPVVDSPPTAFAGHAGQDHADISNAINYLLTLGHAKPDTVQRPQRPVPDQSKPWLRPAVSQDMVSFELDPQRLEQLAETLFAMR